MIYFVESGRRGPIKIGIARNVEKRLKDLQGANPVELHLMVTVPGGWKAEQDLHWRFSSGRIRGEWFKRDTSGLLDLIEHIARYGELPEVEEDNEESCVSCGWLLEPELVRFDARDCLRCSLDAKKPLIPAPEGFRAA